ncbi:MAG: hypothetical protein ILO34_08605 [Kiritimatiellae bacterium]|nr:hypothetical protein [Kiritimatiellia bacterium]
MAVEYIASSGLEDIDTGIACDGNLATSVEITPLAAANNAQNAVFGSAWTGSGYFMMFAVDGYSGYAQCIRFNTGNAYSDAFEGTEWNFGERVSIAADKNGYTINGHRHDIQGGGDESANVKLFWVGNDYGLSHSQYGGVFRLHGCTMTNLVTGEIYRDFIPVRRVSDGAVGLYDTVSGRFFGNASGAGAFTAGEDLEFDRSAPVSADFATLTGTGPASADFAVAVAAIGEGAASADIYADCLRNGTVATTVKVAAVNRAGLVSFTLSPLAPASQYEVAFRVVNNLGATASTRTIAFSTAAETWAYSADYLQLDYIEGTGSQYIWTNVGYSDDLVTEAEVTIDANPAHPTCAIFGSSWCADGYFMMFETDGGVGRIVFNACGTALKVAPGEVWDYGERTTLVGRRNSFSVNGVEYDNVGGGAGNRASWVHLFWVGENFYNIDINTYAGTFKLHHCKMENGSGVLRDYWPAQRLSDGAVGLLDTENEVFYERVGSGAFAAGGAVETLEIETCEYDGSALEVTLTRRLAEEADVYAVWGAQYGYRDAESWQHEAAAGTVSSSGAVTFRLEGADLAGANYLRFYTSRGEWTSTVFLPDYAPPAPEGLKIMVR